MVQKITMIYDGEQPERKDVSADTKTKQLPYWEPFVITEKTTKEMKVTIERWNLMQQCLIDNKLMESK